MTPELASQLLATASEELQHCRALLDALGEQRKALLARDPEAVVSTTHEVEAILQNLTRIASKRSALEAELRALQAAQVLATDPITRAFSPSDRARWQGLHRELASIARRIRDANDFNQQLALDALAYQDLLLRLLSGHANEDAYPTMRPSPGWSTLSVFVNQSA